VENLAEVETRFEEAQRESTSTNDFADERKLFETWLKKNGYSETTVRYYVNQIAFLAKNQINLFDQDSVKEFIAKQQWSRSSKLTICYAYNAFLKMLGLTWEFPHYKAQEKPIWIPTESEIDTLISATGKRTSIYLQLLKETGIRAGEADNLKWINIDSERCLILVASEKNGTPRTLKVSKQLIGRLESLHKDNSSKVFGERSANTMRSTFSRQRKSIAYKMNTPRLLQIHFHTIRHWYATMLYHLTKNPRLVQKRLGHRNLKTTERYIHIEEDIYENESNQHFICEIVRTAEEAKKLIQQGYDFVNRIDGEYIYRKRG
jgi:integrase